MRCLQVSCSIACREVRTVRRQGDLRSQRVGHSPHSPRRVSKGVIDPGVRTAQREAPTKEKRKVDDPAESDLAWELADIISNALPGPDRAHLYAIIGSGDSYTAIEVALQTITRHSLPLPATLINRITTWLEAYAHSDDGPRLQELVHIIKPLPH